MCLCVYYFVYCRHIYIYSPKKRLLMRKIAFIALSALLLASCAPKKKGATISGNVANQAEGQVVFVINDVKDTVALDENGNFEYFLETEKAMYASVVHARNIVNLYIEPGKGFNLNFAQQVSCYYN